MTRLVLFSMVLYIVSIALKFAKNNLGSLGDFKVFLIVIVLMLGAITLASILFKINKHALKAKMAHDNVKNMPKSSRENFKRHSFRRCMNESEKTLNLPNLKIIEGLV